MTTSQQSPELTVNPVEQAISCQPEAPLCFPNHHKFEDFECIKKLGKGSQGQVWLAKHRKTGEKLAIKQLNIHSATTWKQYELFQREAKVLENLDMPGVAPFYEYIEDLSSKSPLVCIVQKFIEGQTLAEMLKSKHRFELKTIYDIILQILQILQNLHQHEPPIIHRDIKPSNLMLTPKDDNSYTVTLLDFGAVANPQVQNGGSTVAGTFGYMPPEQLMGQCVPQSDIYALGAVAVELLSGVSPADIEVCDFKLVIEPHLSHLPAPVVQTLNLMLEPSLEHRICDYNTLTAQFNSFANQNTSSILKIFQRTSSKDIQDVKSICEPGNYELWQTLDQTSDTLPTLFKSNDTASAMEDTKARLAMPSNFRFGLLAMLMLTVAGFFLGSFKLGVVGILLFFCIIIAWFKKFIERNALMDILDTTSHLSKRQFSSQDINIAQSMLKNGLKIVGKITYISYFNLNQNTADAFSINMKRTSYNPYYIFTAEKPIFYVRYQFQLNYQNNPIIFYGELYTHTAPENHYKVGDTITLLADLSSMPSEPYLQLSVMPYPYPFAEVIHLNNILFKLDIDIEILEKKTHSLRLNMVNQIYNQTLPGPLIALCLGDDNAALILADLYQSHLYLPIPYHKVLHYYHLAIHLGLEHAQKLHPNICQKYIKTDIHSLIPETACVLLEKIYSDPEIHNLLEIKKWNEVHLKLNSITDKQSIKTEAISLYQEGVRNETEKNYQTAIDCYKRAVKHNHANAAFQLAHLYETCLNDKYQAIYWLKIAKELGNSSASEQLHLLLEDIKDNKSHLFKLGSAFEKNNDIEDAVFWFKQANNLGSKGAALALGRIYMHHDKDCLTAIKYYQHAYELGDNLAMFHLGCAYREAGNYTQAIHWFEQSATITNDKTAAHSLAKLYEIQFNDKKNANKWYQIARDMKDD